MSKNTLLGVASVIIGGGLILFLYVRREEKKAPMRRVLQLHGKVLREAESVEEIVTRMQAIPLQGCPKPFREAYTSQRHAWQEMAAILAKARAIDEDFESGDKLVTAIVRGENFDEYAFGVIRDAVPRIRSLMGPSRQALDALTDASRDFFFVAFARGVEPSQALFFHPLRSAECLARYGSDR